MIQSKKLLGHLYQTATGENRVGVNGEERRGRKRAAD
jgi:hypothetical protein